MMKWLMNQFYNFHRKHNHGVTNIYMQNIKQHNIKHGGIPVFISIKFDCMFYILQVQHHVINSLIHNIAILLERQISNDFN